MSGDLVAVDNGDLLGLMVSQQSGKNFLKQRLQHHAIAIRGRPWQPCEGHGPCAKREGRQTKRLTEALSQDSALYHMLSRIRGIHKDSTRGNLMPETRNRHEPSDQIAALQTRHASTAIDSAENGSMHRNKLINNG